MAAGEIERAEDVAVKAHVAAQIQVHQTRLAPLGQAVLAAVLAQAPGLSREVLADLATQTDHRRVRAISTGSLGAVPITVDALRTALGRVFMQQKHENLTSSAK